MLVNVHFVVIGFSVAKHLLVQMNYNVIYVHIQVKNDLLVRNVANVSCVRIIYLNIRKLMKFHHQIFLQQQRQQRQQSQR